MYPCVQLEALESRNEDWATRLKPISIQLEIPSVMSEKLPGQYLVRYFGARAGP